LSNLFPIEPAEVFDDYYPCMKAENMQCSAMLIDFMRNSGTKF